MDDDRPVVPDLERMDDQQARQFIEELFTTLSAEKEYALRHEDYAMQMPQSGERIRGPESYYAEPFEAPEWRAHLVERMEP